MKNLKKIGLSALASSLVAVSAQAAEMSVTGTSELTYTTGGGEAGSTTGNPFGSNTSIKFAGSGDVGFGTASIVRTLNDNNGDNSTTASNEYVSAYTMLDMGDIGTFMFDSTGGAITGIRANRDKLPTAYEEVWHGVGGHGLLSAGTANVLGYKNSFGGMSVNIAHVKADAASGTGDGGSSGAGSTESSTDVYVQLDDTGVEGFTAGFGVHTQSNDTLPAGATGEDSSLLANVNYVVGSVSLGYRNNQSQSGTAGTAGQNVDGYAIAFAVNEQLSVSLAMQDREFDNVSTTNVTEESSAINASYTVGSASVRVSYGESENAAGVVNSDDENTEISLLLSF